ncbi:MAG TPA: TlpA disulfide reductase family protein [Polyangiaceae bacterium]|nr:TlpA disulfide reductase family protein [Polyangiaceae bacterium]
MSEGHCGERAQRMRRSLLVLPATLWLSACAAGMGGGGANSAAGASHALVGAPAPAFELREVSGGGDQSLEAYAGKVVIVDFWATWCKPCKESFPAYQKLVTQMGGDLVVVGVSQDDDSKGIAAFLSETGAKFPVVWDDGKAVAKSYDPPSMPTAFVIDKSGIVRFVHVGYRPGDEATLEDEVRSLLR